MSVGTLNADLATLRDSLDFMESVIRSGEAYTETVIAQGMDAATALDRVEAELSRLREERDAARRIAPAVRHVIEKALRRDMTQPPVTREELQVALDLLPEPPSFRSSVDGMAALEAAEARCARLQQALGNLLPYAQLDDPWSVNVEAYRQLLAQAREALAGPDTPATVIDGDELIAAASDPQVQKLLADAREYGVGPDTPAYSQEDKT